MPTFADGETICMTCLKSLPIGSPAVRVEIVALRKRVATLEEVLRDTCKGLDCINGCDKIAHEDDCPMTNPEAALASIRADALDSHADDLQEAASLLYPDDRSNTTVHDLAIGWARSRAEDTRQQKLPCEAAERGLAKSGFQKKVHKQCTAKLYSETKTGESDETPS